MPFYRRSGEPNTLAKARLAGLAVAVATQLAGITHLDGSLTTERLLIAYAAYALLFTDTMYLLWRRRPSLAGALAGGPLVMAGGQALVDKPGVVALALGLLAVNSLYGGRRLAITRTMSLALGLSGLMMAAPLLTPGADDVPASPAVPIVLLCLISIMLRTLYNALVSQEAAAYRESLLARTNRALLGVTDLAQAGEIVRAAVADLCAATPGLQLEVSDLPDGQRILITRPQKPSTEIRDVVETLGAQLSLSEATCTSHAQLVSLAHHDQLTSIANRASFFAGVSSALNTHDHATVALMVIDLDDFKVVNDSLGHAAGDRVLIEIAHRLSTLVAGRGLAGRFGGDEFAVLLWDVLDPEEAEHLARQACDRMIEPVPWEGQLLQVGASIGIVTGGGSADTTAELMRDADIAMYSAKALGKNRVVRFSDAEHGPIADSRQREAEQPGGDARRERLNGLRAEQGQAVVPAENSVPSSAPSSAPA